jgi:hypothetical protein
MSADPVDTIVQAVVEAINAAELAEEVTATAPDFLELDPTDTDLYVCIFPRSEETEAWWTDDTDRSEVDVAILIRQRLDPYSADRVAELKLYARQIRNLLRNAHPLTQIDDYDVNLNAIAHNPLWSPELLRTEQLFLSIILVTYQTEFEVEV